MNAPKAQVLCVLLHLLGLSVDGEGVRPSPAKGIFEALLQRRHNSLQAVQRTVGTLQWFRKFVPNFSYVIRPALLILRAACRTQGQINFDDKCRLAIEQVKMCVEQLPVLVHPNSEWEKELFIACGKYAFAVSFYHVGPDGKRQVLEFWSKVWPLSIVSYTIPERFSLAVRETLMKFMPPLVGVEKLIIYSPTL